MKRTHGVAGVCALTIVALAAPGAAQAANYSVDGHVLAPPTGSKTRVEVPVLLTQRAERRMRLRTGLVRISVPRNGRMAAPSPTGRGTTAILPSTLRAGDRVKATASLSRQTVKRLQTRPVPSFRAGKARVASRASALSTDELTRIVANLGRQLGVLTGRVNSLASLTGTQIGGLLTQAERHTERTGTLMSTIGTLDTSLTKLLGRVTKLEGTVPNAAELLALRGDITALLNRVSSVESATGGLRTNLQSVTGTLTGLEGNLASLGGQVTALTTTVTGLGARTTSAETLLTQLPGLISQVTSLDGSLVAISGRVTTTEGQLGSLGSSVTGLQTTVDGLRTEVTGLSTKVAALCGSSLLTGVCP